MPWQFLRFCLVGGVGFLADAALLTLAIQGLGAGPYGGRLLSYLGAATTTWWLNRVFTFAAPNSTNSPAQPAARQWAGFLAVNALGGAVNYGTYALLVAAHPLVAEQPVIGVAAGSLAGLAFNFTLSRRLVFRAAGTPSKA